MSQSQHAAKRWCFTINNYTAAELQAILDSADNFDYLIVARELGDSGTPHLQGFLILQTKLRLRNVKALPGFQRAHLEVSRGTPKEASDYCKKDGDYDEFGTLPETQGKRNDFERFKDWLLSLDERPTEADIFIEFPSLYGRYRQNLQHIVNLIAPHTKIIRDPELCTLRPWQQSLHDIISVEPVNNRIIHFYVDPDGNSGKTWMTQYLFSTIPHLVQILSVGKRDDLAHAIDDTKRIFLFDVPRRGMEFLQYTVLEKLKDGIVFSPKYNSQTKILRSRKVHVIVFCNEQPDRDAMSHDRYSVTRVHAQGWELQQLMDNN